MKIFENKNCREIIRYLIVGVLTTVVSLGTYYGLTLTVLDPDNAVQLQIANVLSWIAAVTFAYFANRKYVFRSENRGDDPHGTTPVAPKPRDMKANALPMHVAVSGRDITVSGLRQGDAVLVLDMKGCLVVSARVHGASATLNVPRAGFYIVRNANRSRKVRIR